MMVGADATCKAVLVTANGVEHRCTAIAEQGDFCYLHGKYADGLCHPTFSPYQEDSIPLMRHAVTGEQWEFEVWTPQVEEWQGGEEEDAVSVSE